MGKGLRLMPPASRSKPSETAAIHAVERQQTAAKRKPGKGRKRLSAHFKKRAVRSGKLQASGRGKPGLRRAPRPGGKKRAVRGTYNQGYSRGYDQGFDAGFAKGLEDGLEANYLSA